MKKFLPSKEFWFCVIAFLLGVVCFGCNANRPPVKYCIQTNCPDVWAEKPVQNISVKMEFSH